jgi:repressor LexA
MENNLGNKESMAQNIKKFMAKKNISRMELCKALGFNYSTLADWLHARKYPRIDKIEMMANYFGVSKADLVEQDSDLQTKRITTMDVIKIPLLGRVVAGDPQEAIQEADEFLYIPAMGHKRSEDYFALRVCGESMEPNLLDGDIAIVHIQPEIDSGQIAVVLIDNQDSTVKRVFISQDGITLVADNPAVFQPRFFSNDDCLTMPVRILGRVVSIQREM